MRRTPQSEGVLDEWEEEDEDSGLTSVRSPFFYALFITLCGALLSSSSPGWVLVLIVAALIAGCFRLASLDTTRIAQESVLHDPHAHPQGTASTSSSTSNVLALLRAGRVVVLPRSGFAHSRLHNVDDLEQAIGSGRLPAGQERLLLAQLTQQLGALRSRVAAVSGHPTSTVSPVSDEELDCLPTSKYQLPSSGGAPKGDSGQRKGAGGSGTGADTGTGTTSQGDGVKGGDASGGIMCSICLDELEPGAEFMTLPCMHMFHVGCVRPWLKAQGRHVGCPMCKTPVFM